jgi:nitrate/nitrite transporter NarK
VSQQSLETSLTRSLNHYTEQYDAASTPEAQAVLAKVYRTALPDEDVRMQLEQQLQRYAAVLVGKQQQAAAKGSTASTVNLQAVDGWIAAIGALNALALQVTLHCILTHTHDADFHMLAMYMKAFGVTLQCTYICTAAPSSTQLLLQSTTVLL